MASRCGWTCRRRRVGGEVGGEVGERRTVKFAPAALHFGEEVDMKAARGGPEASKDDKREALKADIEETVARNYYALAEKLEPLFD